MCNLLINGSLYYQWYNKNTLYHLAKEFIRQPSTKSVEIVDSNDKTLYIWSK